MQESARPRLVYGLLLAGQLAHHSKCILWSYRRAAEPINRHLSKPKLKLRDIPVRFKPLVRPPERLFVRVMFSILLFSSLTFRSFTLSISSARTLGTMPNPPEYPDTALSALPCKG
jgi:hypothetical protein